MTDIKERIQVFIKYKGLTIKKFEEDCHLSNGYISSMRKGFGTEKLNNVLSKYPELNREWLLYGEGEMLRSSVIQQAGDVDGNDNHVNVYNSSQTIEKMIDAITAQQRLTANAQRQTDKSQAQIDKAQAQIDRLLALLEKCHSVERQNA